MEQPQPEPWMVDQEAAWWAKMRRADAHRTDLAAMAREFNESEPYTLTREDTGNPEEVAFRLHIHRETPADISTAIGDVLHNLRSALDSIAFELARRTVGHDLNRRDEQATEFPICRDPDTFSTFFELKRNGRSVRAHLYDDRARAALRAAQPFYWGTVVAADTEEEQQTRFQDEYEWSLLRRLRVLNNVDKHRRLASVSVGRWPSLIYFGSDEDDKTQFRWGHFPVEDDTILCYLVGPKARATELRHEFALVLTDDPMHRPGTGEPYIPRDCLVLLDGMRQSVGTALTQVFHGYLQWTV